MKFDPKKAAAVFVAVLAVFTLCVCWFGSQVRQRREAEAAAAAAASEAAEQARLAQEEAQRLAELVQAEEEARLAEEKEAEEAAKEAMRELGAAELETAEYGDLLGKVTVENTTIDCLLYWGDSDALLNLGAACHAADGCVKPGGIGTVFVGGHTGSYFATLGDAQIGDRITLQTVGGTYQYEIYETAVIQETDIDACCWGGQEPLCILYTCYPFGILTHTPQRYLVYASPVSD